jgi:predicted metal-binding membrane protein
MADDLGDRCPAAGLLGLAALAAAALWAVGRTEWAPVVHHGPGHHAGVAPGLAAAAWLAGWGLMVASMMLPVAAPMVGAMARSGPGRAAGGFAAAGFLGVWVAAGLAVLAGVTLAGEAAPPPGLLAGAALLAAGVYQVLPAKRRALARCRAHVRLLSAVADRSDPTGHGLRAGVCHGVSSLACCGPLMAAVAVGGMGEPALMAVLAGTMVAEEALPRGPRVSAPLGAALVAAGLVVLALGAAPG